MKNFPTENSATTLKALQSLTLGIFVFIALSAWVMGCNRLREELGDLQFGLQFTTLHDLKTGAGVYLREEKTEASQPRQPIGVVESISPAGDGWLVRVRVDRLNRKSIREGTFCTIDSSLLGRYPSFVECHLPPLFEKAPPVGPNAILPGKSEISYRTIILLEEKLRPMLGRLLEHMVDAEEFSRSPEFTQMLVEVTSLARQFDRLMGVQGQLFTQEVNARVENAFNDATQKAQGQGKNDLAAELRALQKQFQSNLGQNDQAPNKGNPLPGASQSAPGQAVAPYSE